MKPIQKTDLPGRQRLRDEGNEVGALGRSVPQRQWQNLLSTTTWQLGWNGKVRKMEADFEFGRVLEG